MDRYTRIRVHLSAWALIATMMAVGFAWAVAVGA